MSKTAWKQIKQPEELGKGKLHPTHPTVTTKGVLGPKPSAPGKKKVVSKRG